LAATLVLIAMVTCRHAAKADDIDDYVQVQLGRRQIPGLSLAVVQDGKVLKAQGYGLANIETHSPVTPETVFKIGSMSKQFVAAAIMLLIEEGQLRLDDRIDSHLEGLPAAWHDISVRHLMSHTSGLVRDEPHFDPFQSTSNADVIRSTFSSPLAFRPGEKWSYSNINYYVLAEIVTHLSGTPWHEFVATHIFVPLQMTGTRMCSMSDIVSDRADGYTQSAAGVKNAEIWLAVRPSGPFSRRSLILPSGTPPCGTTRYCQKRVAPKCGLRLGWRTVRNADTGLAGLLTLNKAGGGYATTAGFLDSRPTSNAIWTIASL
jgi:D-alanyl-D-alanine carboxypeptidase